MTFSIIARCPHTGRLGLGIATFSIGSGGRCEGIQAGVGICKSQAFTNRGNDPLAHDRAVDGHGFMGARRPEVVSLGALERACVRTFPAASGARSERPLRRHDRRDER